MHSSLEVSYRDFRAWESNVGSNPKGRRTHETCLAAESVAGNEIDPTGGPQVRLLSG